MKIDGACHCGYIRVEGEADPEKTTVCQPWCYLSHNGPAGDIPQDHGRERQSTPAGILSALRLADLFDLAGGGAAGVLHGTGGDLAPEPRFHPTPAELVPLG